MSFLSPSRSKSLYQRGHVLRSRPPPKRPSWPIHVLPSSLLLQKIMPKEPCPLFSALLRSSPLFSALLLSPQKIKMCLPMVSSSSPLLLLLSKYNHHWHMSRKLRCMDAMSRFQHQRARCPMELGWDAAGPRSLEDSDGWLASPRLAFKEQYGRSMVLPLLLLLSSPPRKQLDRPSCPEKSSSSI
jgi:hypothetical protein